MCGMNKPGLSCSAALIREVEQKWTDSSDKRTQYFCGASEFQSFGLAVISSKTHLSIDYEQRFFLMKFYH